MTGYRRASDVAALVLAASWGAGDAPIRLEGQEIGALHAPYGEGEVEYLGGFQGLRSE